MVICDCVVIFGKYVVTLRVLIEKEQWQETVICWEISNFLEYLASSTPRRLRKIRVTFDTDTNGVLSATDTDESTIK